MFVVRCAEKSGGEGEGGRRFVFASFHGDTNGLATIPVVDALDKTMRLIEVDEAEAAETPVHWTEVPAPPLLLFWPGRGFIANKRSTDVVSSSSSSSGRLFEHSSSR